MYIIIKIIFTESVSYAFDQQILFITKKICVLMLETFYFYKLVIAYYYLIYVMNVIYDNKYLAEYELQHL